MKKLKVYLIYGHQSAYKTDDSGEWELTLTNTYLLEAHTNKNVAKRRVLNLKQAVKNWYHARYDQTIRKGVRAEVFLSELAKTAGDVTLTEDSTYDLSEIQVIKD